MSPRPRPRLPRGTTPDEWSSYHASYPDRIIVTSTDKTLKTIDPETGEVRHGSLLRSAFGTR